MHLSLFDVAARFDHLKPAQVLDGFVGALNGPANGILNGSGGSASKLDEFIDWVFHTRFFRYRKRTIENQAICCLCLVAVNVFWRLAFQSRLRGGPIIRHGVKPYRGLWELPASKNGPSERCALSCRRSLSHVAVASKQAAQDRKSTRLNSSH